MSGEPQALLERLVGQFASPYDFLRELVQNAMDAGSDLVEVELHEHPGEHEAEVVFELVVIDAGQGMDREIIDGEFTRLFATSKTGDRTMAGGFGIGFVSVFAWEPERVIVQTGRQGEAWELLFREDRRFETRAVDMPLEGTTVRLFRTGAPSQRRAIADAVVDALQRWCRFVPVELTFEDVAGGDGPQVLGEPIELTDVAASTAWSEGPTRAVLGFDADAHAVLLRRGLVLEEGSARDLLPALGERVGAQTMEHLSVRLDSPRLETGLARDGAVDSETRKRLELALEPAVAQLRERLAQRVAEVAARAPWGDAAAVAYSHMHAHLSLEHARVRELSARPVLRLATGTAVSLQTLRTRAKRGVVSVTEDGPLELRLLALRSGVPVLHGRWQHDASWLRALLETVGLQVFPLEEAVSRTHPDETPAALAQLTLGLLPAAYRPSALRWGTLDDADADVLGGIEYAQAGVMTGGAWTAERLRGRPLWLACEHPVVRRAETTAVRRPEVAALGLAFAILSRTDRPPDPLDDAWRRMA